MQKELLPNNITHFSAFISNSTDIFRQLLSNNITHIFQSLLQTIYSQRAATATKQHYTLFPHLILKNNSTLREFPSNNATQFLEFISNNY